MRPIVRYISVLMLCCFIHHSLQAQISESELEAAYIERFTRFIEWPEEFKNNTFKIAVIGKNPFNRSLDKLFDATKIKNQKAEIIYTDDINEITKVDLIFISHSEKKRIKEILALIDKKPILIISDTKGFGEMGTHINMYIDGNYLRYEINQMAIKESGLKANSLLLTSAKIVTTNE